jgi:drug/metabolite transporter (DMT)-like permease
MNVRNTGIASALASALFLGLSPIFGKQAILYGLAPLTVVAIRTILAAILLLAVMAIFQRKYLYIYPVGLLGCLLAGGINGLGSLFYYSALGRIDAGVGHLIYSLYPIFVAFWMILDHQPPSKLTILRMSLALVSIGLLTQAGGDSLDLAGVLMMLIASILYALHLPINQRVLYDIPAPTVTLYTLFAMSAVVVPAFFLAGSWAPPQNNLYWAPIAGITLATFFSRLTLFIGVKKLGGLQTAIIGLGELLITVSLATIWLGERLNTQQWIGALFLVISIFLVNAEKNPPPTRATGGWLHWLTPPKTSKDFPFK